MENGYQITNLYTLIQTPEKMPENKFGIQKKSYINLELAPESGGGANTKVPDMYGVGGVFGTQNTKVTCTLLYNKGGVSIFYPESQKYKWYFCTHIS